MVVSFQRILHYRNVITNETKNTRIPKKKKKKKKFFLYINLKNLKNCRKDPKRRSFWI